MYQANILINSSGAACLTDFGLTTALHSTGTFTATGSSRGTLRWMAPELFGDNDLPEDSVTLTESSDIYALAMVMWEAGRLSRNFYLTQLIESIRTGLH